MQTSAAPSNRILLQHVPASPKMSPNPLRKFVAVVAQIAPGKHRPAHRHCNLRRAGMYLLYRDRWRPRRIQPCDY